MNETLQNTDYGPREPEANEQEEIREKQKERFGEKIGRVFRELIGKSEPESATVAKVPDEAETAARMAKLEEIRAEAREKGEENREILAESINGTLTPRDELISQVDAGAKESSKRTVEYGGKLITIYNIGNIDANSVIYPIQDQKYDKSQGQLATHPELWDKERDIAGDKEGARNIIRARYFITKMLRLGNQQIKGVGHGYMHIRPKTIVDVTNIDESKNYDDEVRENNIIGGIGNYKKSSEYLAKSIARMEFFQLRKYGDEDQPLYRPSVITMHPRSSFSKGEEGDAEYNKELRIALKQASYFDVPIIEIPDDKVPTKEEKETKRRDDIDAISAEIKEKIDIAIENLKPKDALKEKLLLKRLTKSSKKEEWGKLDPQQQLYRDLRELVEERERLEEQHGPKKPTGPEKPSQSETLAA